MCDMNNKDDKCITLQQGVVLTILNAFITALITAILLFLLPDYN